MNARHQSSLQRAALLAATKAGDVSEIRDLLDAGVHPSSSFKNKKAIHVALYSGQEALVRPFIEAYLREAENARVNPLNAIALRLFEDDSFSVQFTAEMAVFARPELNALGWNAQQIWTVQLTRMRDPFKDRDPAAPRDPLVLAGKVLVAIQHGWRTADSWFHGCLPHHCFLSQGFVDAAVVCVRDGGANPNEPTRCWGLESPETFEMWPAFQAALRAKRANDVPVIASTASRKRQRS